jgi:hypothetical protein
VLAHSEIAIALPDGAAVSASLHGSGPTFLALGHGAGGTRRTPALVSFAERIAATGRTALLYNFPYSEAGRRLPDRAPALEATVAAVARAARERLGARRLVLGGRSMGGRMAAQAVAAGLAADGLVLLSYPLHPPGKPQQLRDAHLPRITCPMLFVQGTRDGFARFDLLEETLAGLGARATLHVLADADHSFKVPKRLGRSPAEVEDEVLGAVTGWLARHDL